MATTIKEVERKQFKAIITSETDFRTKIIDPLKSWYTNGLPNHLNENITYYNFTMLYNLLDNKWHNFYTIDEEESFIRNFRNVMFDLLPTLHFRTIKLKNETQEKIDANAIFTASETTSFKDPDNNFLETQSAESESPETKGKLFGDETRTTAKSYSRTTDKRVNVLEKEDRVSALKNYDEVSFSGEMDSFVNSRQISTLFLDVTDGELAKGSYKIDVEVLRESEIENIKTELSNGLKGEKGEKGDKGDAGEKPDLNNYLTATEINNDFLNKKTADLNEVMGNIAIPRVILTETPVANSNQAARMEDVQKAVEGIGTGTGNFVETNYFSDNAKLLTRNDKISTETAKIGEGYKGIIDIGFQATGTLRIGQEAAGSLFIGSSSTGFVNIGGGARGNLRIGKGAFGALSLGDNSTGGLSIGDSAARGINIGKGALGDIDIGDQATGTITIGERATGVLTIGERAIGNIDIGDQATGILYIGTAGTGDINIGLNAFGNLFIGTQATRTIHIGHRTTGFIGIGNEAAGDINIGNKATENLFIGSSAWKTPEAPNRGGYLVSGDTEATFRDIIDKANEKVDSFVATGNTGAPLGTINNTTSQFFNGGTITTGNTVKLDFINSNYTFTENINPGFSLIRNDTKKLDIGQSNKRVFVKVGVIINSFSGASVGQLEIALNSGNIDIGTDSIVLINPNPNAFFVKTIGVLNSDLVKQEGISINLTSQNGNFVIGGLEVILL